MNVDTYSITIQFPNTSHVFQCLTILSSNKIKAPGKQQHKNVD